MDSIRSGGGLGTVVSIGSSSDNASWRSWAKVKWAAGGTNDYRRAHLGYQDLKCSQEGIGEKYYVDHLSALSKFERKLDVRNEVHPKDTISRILWYSDWLHNTTSAGKGIFVVTNHNTTSGGGRSIMWPIRLPYRIWEFKKKHIR